MASLRTFSSSFHHPFYCYLLSYFEGLLRDIARLLCSNLASRSGIDAGWLLKESRKPTLDELPKQTRNQKSKYITRSSSSHSLLLFYFCGGWVIRLTPDAQLTKHFHYLNDLTVRQYLITLDNTLMLGLHRDFFASSATAPNVVERPFANIYIN